MIRDSSSLLSSASTLLRSAYDTVVALKETLRILIHLGKGQENGSISPSNWAFQPSGSRKPPSPDIQSSFCQADLALSPQRPWEEDKEISHCGIPVLLSDRAHVLAPRCRIVLDGVSVSFLPSVHVHLKMCWLIRETEAPVSVSKVIGLSFTVKVTLNASLRLFVYDMLYKGTCVSPSSTNDAFSSPSFTNWVFAGGWSVLRLRHPAANWPNLLQAFHV